ncbi:unnamed protein product [Rhizoctonia solani]|uniref:cellulase n=1 Tax=Rhizoctonia solani TaxID=456999 RepID=A0A8H3ATN0_9AGAM|nr:unnamed protein product [Rhizoctonia solani]
MIVQATNTGGDLGNNHFDLMVPGGGVGYDIQYPVDLTHQPDQYSFSEYLDKAAPPNTVPHPPDGVRNMVAYQASPNAPSSLQRYKLAASGVLHGSKVLIILRFVPQFSTVEILLATDT